MSDKNKPGIILGNMDPKEFKKTLVAAVRQILREHLQKDEKGRVWLVDEHGNKVQQMVRYEASTKSETADDREVIKEASQMSLQKKEERLVINLPAWLKDMLKKRARQTDQSMNEIIRIALTEYLAKQ